MAKIINRAINELKAGNRERGLTLLALGYSTWDRKSDIEKSVRSRRGNMSEAAWDELNNKKRLFFKSPPSGRFEKLYYTATHVSPYASGLIAVIHAIVDATRGTKDEFIEYHGPNHGPLLRLVMNMHHMFPRSSENTVVDPNVEFLKEILYQTYMPFVIAALDRIDYLNELSDIQVYAFFDAIRKLDDTPLGAPVEYRQKLFLKKLELADRINSGEAFALSF